MMPDEKPNVFISWSGSQSKHIARAIRDWLPDVIPAARPWMSSEDIAKGSVWAQEINSNLSSCSIGIVILTPENLVAPWVLFEAGALFKAFEDRYICTLLHDLELPLTGPLGQFQATKLDKEDLRQLVVSIHANLDTTFDAARVPRAFDAFYSHLEKELSSIPAAVAAKKPADSKEERKSDILADLLSTVRSISKRQVDLSSELGLLRNLMVHNDSALQRARSHAYEAVFSPSSLSHSYISIELSNQARARLGDLGVDQDRFVSSIYPTIIELYSDHPVVTEGMFIHPFDAVELACRYSSKRISSANGLVVQIDSVKLHK